MDKSEVIRLGVELGVDLELTLSCMNPQDGDAHCGRCSKCRERRDAFIEAGVVDPTLYARWRRCARAVERKAFPHPKPLSQGEGLRYF